jgi:hypothetical protein
MTGDDSELAQAQKAAARIAARANIRDVRLLRSEVALERVPQAENLAYELSAEVSVEYDDGPEPSPFFVLRIAYRVVIEEMTQPSPAVGEASATNDVEPGADDSEEELLADLKFELAAFFSLRMRKDDGPPTAAELQAYADTTGRFALHPYAREYIHDITGRLGLPPLTVGVMRLPFREEADADVRPA